MSKAPSTHASKPSKFRSRFVIGRERFARISAVEGIKLSAEEREILARFDREGLSAEERRRSIFARFTPAR